MGAELIKTAVKFFILYFFFWIVGQIYFTTDTAEKQQDVPVLNLLNITERKNIPAAVPRRFPVLKAYVNTDENDPWSRDRTSALQLRAFPDASRQISCHDGVPSAFPIIDSYPEGDAYLPWIHDVFPNENGKDIIILAQNRRRCHTGTKNLKIMKSLEGQIALMQPLSVERDILNGPYELRGNTTYRLTSHEDADVDGKETRFMCRFKVLSESTLMFQESSYAITLSRYPFNYEYVSWQKATRMFIETGQDMGSFWLSSIEFHCPVPSHIIPILHGIGESRRQNPLVYLDIATIRTPVRRPGQQSFATHHYGSFDAKAEWGSNLALPSFDDSGRWENIPICSPTRNFPNKDEGRGAAIKVGQPHLPVNHTPKEEKTFQLVACTWTSAIHNRRGDARTIDDGADRLLEWITFHLLAGFDHIVVYDNSAANTNVTLKEVTDKFSSEQVTHVNWPCEICNNNRPAHNDPGERSSQYAAEASCRSRFGPLTDWMAFMDPDEYFIPMGKYTNWKEILTQTYKEEGVKVLKFRSTRARPRISLMDSYTSPDNCHSGDSCFARKSNETFLKTYNCEYIKSPKPMRFQRAMKQIYRTDFVLSHFVHYSTVTTNMVFGKTTPRKVNRKDQKQPIDERFIDEINEGVLVHAKTTPPDETIGYVDACRYKSKGVCDLGFPCPDDLSFSDQTHKDGFQDPMGKFCNCWVNRQVEDLWVPQLEDALNVLRKQ